jgi:hypothetical protein
LTNQIFLIDGSISFIHLFRKKRNSSVSDEQVPIRMDSASKSQFTTRASAYSKYKETYQDDPNFASDKMTAISVSPPTNTPGTDMKLKLTPPLSL